MRPIHFTTPDQRSIELQLWSDHDLDTLAQITETDKQRAASYWRRVLPKRFRELLNALSTVRQ